VHDNGHFVLITGLVEGQDDLFAVHDPFYTTSAYPYANITDILEYTTGPSLRGGATVSGATVAPGFGSATVRGSDVIIPFSMPLFKQCDSRWGSDHMGTDTICEVGCLMSSTSMALNGRGITIGGKGGVINPGTFNSWLRSNGGYENNDLIESAVPKVDPGKVSWPSDGMHTSNDIPLSHIQSMLRGGRPVIANVMHGQHFVLVVGWNSTNPDALAVNDPGFNNLFYSYSNDVVGWRLFDMSFV
jgi:hypothetical protein